MTTKKKSKEQFFGVEVIQGSEVSFFKAKIKTREEVGNLLVIIDRASKQGIWYTMKVEIGK